MRVACAVLLTTVLLAGSALAGPYDALAPGKPAGVHRAQTAMTVGTVVLGAGALLGMVLAIQSGGADVITPSTPAPNPSNIAAREAATLNTFTQ